MSLTEDVEVLRNIPLFAKIEPAKLKLLAFTSERVNYLPGEQVCGQGDPGNAAYIILKGEADVVVDTPSGVVKVATMVKNDIIGEIAVLCDVPRTATVIATTELQTLRVCKEHFIQLIIQFPHIGLKIMHELASRLHHTTLDLTEARIRLDELAAPGGPA